MIKIVNFFSPSSNFIELFFCTRRLQFWQNCLKEERKLFAQIPKKKKSSAKFPQSHSNCSSGQLECGVDDSARNLKVSSNLWNLTLEFQKKHYRHVLFEKFLFPQNVNAECSFDNLEEKMSTEVKQKSRCASPNQNWKNVPPRKLSLFEMVLLKHRMRFWQSWGKFSPISENLTLEIQEMSLKSMLYSRQLFFLKMILCTRKKQFWKPCQTFAMKVCPLRSWKVQKLEANEKIS